MRAPTHPRPSAQGTQLVRNPSNRDAKDRLRQIFAGCFGAFLGLSLLKFGNPPIMEKWVAAPINALEFLLGYPWPISWAYWLLAMLGLFGLVLALRSPSLDTRHSTPNSIPRWLVVLPLVWL